MAQESKGVGSVAQSRQLAAALLESARLPMTRGGQVSEKAHQALDAIAEVPGLNLSQLATRLGCRLPSASRLTDRLVAAGLITKGKSSNRGDSQREVCVRLTAAGRVARRERTEALARQLRPALVDLTPAARNALADHLPELARALANHKPT